MKATIPTLTSSGFVGDLDEGGSHLLSLFLTTDGYQSTEYNGKLHSLPNLVATVGDKPNELEVAVKKSLITLYNAYYSDADADVKVVTEEGESNIIVSLEFTDGNYVKHLDETLHVSKENIITILGKEND